MKKLLMMSAVFFIIASGASAAILLDETFDYPDGSLVGNGLWANHSGTEGDFLVEDGQAVVQHGAPSEDVNHPITPAPDGDVYFSFDFSVDDLGHPYAPDGDYEYFAHFKNDEFSFVARLDVVNPSGGGDFTLGISSTTSTAEAVWGSDLTFDTVYRVVVRFSQGENIAQLWIDSTLYAGESILGLDGDDPGIAVTQFAMRQSDSTENETVRIDNLVVGDSCEDFFTDCTVATEDKSWEEIKSYYR